MLTDFSRLNIFVIGSKRFVDLWESLWSILSINKELQVLQRTGYKPVQVSTQFGSTF